VCLAADFWTITRARTRVEWYHLFEEKLLFHSDWEKQSFALSMPPQVENSWAAY